MFDNCLASGAASQFNVYAAPGDAVIQVYVDETVGLTNAQILANAASIKSKMEAKINALGPQSVSKHCGDPSKLSVVDLALSAFNNNNKGLFKAAILPRLSPAPPGQLLEENGVFHIQLPTGQSSTPGGCHPRVLHSWQHFFMPLRTMTLSLQQMACLAGAPNH
jgi:hypothetical protein